MYFRSTLLCGLIFYACFMIEPSISLGQFDPPLPPDYFENINRDDRTKEEKKQDRSELRRVRREMLARINELLWFNIDDDENEENYSHLQEITVTLHRHDATLFTEVLTGPNIIFDDERIISTQDPVAIELAEKCLPFVCITKNGFRRLSKTGQESRSNSIVLAVAPMGKISFRTTRGTVDIYITSGGFQLQSEDQKALCFFSDYSLTRILDRIVQTEIEEGLPEAAIGTLSGEAGREITKIQYERLLERLESEREEQ